MKIEGWGGQRAPDKTQTDISLSSSKYISTYLLKKTSKHAHAVLQIYRMQSGSTALEYSGAWVPILSQLGQAEKRPLGRSSVPCPSGQAEKRPPVVLLVYAHMGSTSEDGSMHTWLRAHNVNI